MHATPQTATHRVHADVDHAALLMGAVEQRRAVGPERGEERLQRLIASESPVPLAAAGGVGLLGAPPGLGSGGGLPALACIGGSSVSERAMS